jgi:hypothetical protein
MRIWPYAGINIRILLSKLLMRTLLLIPCTSDRENKMRSQVDNYVIEVSVLKVNIAVPYT